MQVPTNRVGISVQSRVTAGATQVSSLATSDPNWWEVTSDLSNDSPPAGAKSIGTAGVSPRALDASPCKILCVHGVGHHEGDPANEGAWRAAIAAALQAASAQIQPVIEFVAYDAFFAAAPLGPKEIAAALWKLGRSGLVSGWSDLFGERSRGDFSGTLRWTAGMVVQWAEDENLRANCRKAVADHVQAFRPDLILAHSLGTLLSYDTFSREETAGLLENRVFTTFGSQIGNAFVRSTVAFNGRIENLTAARHWFHLFNEHDDAFTARLRLVADNFSQVDTPFDIPGVMDHDAGHYITHPRAVDMLWKTLGNSDAGSAIREAKGRPTSTQAAAAKPIHSFNIRAPKPQRRALLVGINDYPNPDMRLEGCVNDVFLMSEVLQELKFDAQNVRIVLNDRATASAILERLDWLLDGSQSGQERVFYYSGHGAQLPGYGVNETVDTCDECLVPWDFDWTLEHAVTDNQFHDFYSQLPYDTRFLTVLDCCHSGGMARDGGMRVRGINPPDDIRHRLLEWTGKSWRPRFERAVVAESRANALQPLQRDSFMKKLGRAADLRPDAGKSFKAACKAKGHKGPYMPVILEACQENEYAYEYRHGATPQGAFTWMLAQTVRQGMKKTASWNDLVAAVDRGLKALKYPQTPRDDGPTAVLKKPIGWFK